jgi:predicted DNA-binding transcriptional regulator YafY
MRKKGPGNIRISQYLCNRIESPAVTSKPNRVPKNFSTRKFIRAGKMAVEVRELKELAQSTFTLKLRFYNGDDNLRLDLEEFPLVANKQAIEDEPGTGNFVLTAPGVRAYYHLVDWILGRMDRVEVLEPISLRNYVRDRIEKMHQRYA